MNILNIDGNWDEKKTALQKNFDQLTDKDLQYSKGQETELVRRIQHRLGIPKHIAKKLIRYS